MYMRFSIIIPVYNVEKYIRRCMETVMGQTFRDYEVIVVDDESPDRSMDIVAEFADRYPGMVKMLHQKNTRQGGARNHGVREAQGEYLIFVDSDDYVSLQMLETVDRKLKEMPCDILIFQNQIVTQEGKRIAEGAHGGLAPGRYIPRQDRFVLQIPCEPWKKAYRRAFYLESGFAFPEKILYEDAITRLLYAKASSIVICEDILYYYVQSTNSSIRQKPDRRFLDILKMTDLTRKTFEENGIYDHYREELDVSLLTGILFVFNLVNKADRTSPLQNEFADYIQEHFPDYAKNTCIYPENKAAVDCILSRDYNRYHIRFLLKQELLEWIMGLRLFSELNRIRKRILQRRRGLK